MKIISVLNHGKTQWVLDNIVDGKRSRRFFTTKAEAQDAYRVAKDARSTGLDGWLVLDERERREVLNAVAEARAAGLSIGQVWGSYRASGKVATRKTLREGIAEMLALKENANRRAKYVRTLTSYLGRFAAGRDEMFVDQITTEQVEEWFTKRGEPPNSKASNLMLLGVFFSFALQRGWALTNPCAAVVKPSIEYKPRRFLTVDEAQKVLVYCFQKDRDLLHWVVLIMLCGVRFEEWEKMVWQNVDVERGLIEVPASAAKTRRERYIELEPMAKAWLRLCKAGDPEETLEVMNFRRKRVKMQKALGLIWEKNILRHTYATYSLGHTKDAAKVALRMGNSPEVLRKNYAQKVRPEDCEAFWQILPIAPVESAANRA